MSEPAIATFAAGCFWGVESIFSQLPGVLDAKSGYTGGSVVDPTYRQVCSGATGHAEAVEVRFDPGVISFDQLLDTFWKLHDPTTMNRQGPDIGSQYRSAIFVHSDEQGDAARASLARAQANFKKPIVTLIEPAGPFYVAEEYHQKYFEKNGAACHINV